MKKSRNPKPADLDDDGPTDPNKFPDLIREYGLALVTEAFRQIDAENRAEAALPKFVPSIYKLSIVLGCDRATLARYEIRDHRFPPKTSKGYDVHLIGVFLHILRSERTGESGAEIISYLWASLADAVAGRVWSK